MKHGMFGTIYRSGEIRSEFEQEGVYSYHDDHFGRNHSLKNWRWHPDWGLFFNCGSYIETFEYERVIEHLMKRLNCKLDEDGYILKGGKDGNE